MKPTLSAAVAAHKQLVESIKALYPGEDEASLADTIEGQTDLDSVILSVLRESADAGDNAEALKAMKKAWNERTDARIARLVAKEETLRALALHAMVEAGLPTIWGADMTASVSAGQPKVIITDESAIPDHFMRVTRAPNKNAIAEQLKHGGEVEGCTLGNPQPTLRISRS